MEKEIDPDCVIRMTREEFENLKIENTRLREALEDIVYDISNDETSMHLIEGNAIRALGWE